MNEKFHKQIQNRVSTELYKKIKQNESVQNFTALDVQEIKNSCFFEYELLEESGEFISIPSLHTSLAELDLEVVRDLIIRLESILKPEKPEAFSKASGQSFTNFVRGYFRYLTELFVERYIEKAIAYTKNPDDDFRKNPKEPASWRTSVNTNDGKESFDLMTIQNSEVIYDGKSTRLNKLIEGLIANSSKSQKNTSKREMIDLDNWIISLTNEKYEDIIKKRRAH